MMVKPWLTHMLMTVDDGVSMSSHGYLMATWWLCHGKELWFTVNHELWVNDGALLV